MSKLTKIVESPMYCKCSLKFPKSSTRQTQLVFDWLNTVIIFGRCPSLTNLGWRYLKRHWIEISLRQKIKTPNLILLTSKLKISPQEILKPLRESWIWNHSNRIFILFGRKSEKNYWIEAWIIPIVTGLLWIFYLFKRSKMIKHINIESD